MSTSYRKTQKSGKHPSKRAENEENSAALMGKHLLKSLGITLLAAFALLLCASLAAYFSPDPARLIQPLGLLASLLTALVGGFAAVRIHGRSGLLCGLCNGTLFLALMLPTSLFFTPFASGYSALVSCLLHAAFLLLSMLGGYLGLKKGKPKKKKY